MKEKILAVNTRYTSQVQTLLNELAAFENERLNQKPVDGGWSGIQTLHHLILVEENSLAYIRKKLSFNPQLEKTGLGSWWRSLLLRAILRMPFKFKAPKSAGNERIPETDTLKEVSARWQSIRDEWQEFFEKMPTELADKSAYKHPRAGRLGWLHMLDFFASHFERHRGQVHRTVR
ncbi:MAG: DinB family protein [Saprospiraceae bacterium]|nr:DinB family protein [Saprospiraceae bacterium]